MPMPEAAPTPTATPTATDFAGRDAARAAAEAWFDGHFVDDLAALVACPSESQSGRHDAHLLAYLRDLAGPRLAALGFEVALHDNPLPGGAPFLTALRIEGADLPTVLIYGHGDVCDPQEGRWQAGRDPYRLAVEGPRAYGRGAADNKGQHLVNIAALAQVIAARGRLGFNAKIVLEMAEETGSQGLAAFFAAERARLSADVLIASDGPRLAEDRPTIFLGSRAALNFRLRADFRPGALHSGNFGGLVADPALVLVQAIASITDARGQIRIPAWRPEASLTPAFRAAVADLPVGGGLAVDADWGEAGLTPAERAFGWNSFAVLSMLSGVPEAPQNAIAGHAEASCQLRYVVGTDPAAILPALRAHLDRHGFERVEIIAGKEAPVPATRIDPDHPWVRFVEGSIAASLGQGPHVLPNLAGSIPNDAFTEVLGLPTIWVPHSYGGCNQHAPDEHVLLPLMREGLSLMTGLFWDIGTPGAAPPGVLQPAR